MADRITEAELKELMEKLLDAGVKAEVAHLLVKAIVAAPEGDDRSLFDLVTQMLWRKRFGESDA